MVIEKEKHLYKCIQNEATASFWKIKGGYCWNKHEPKPGIWDTSEKLLARVKHKHLCGCATGILAQPAMLLYCRTVSFNQTNLICLSVLWKMYIYAGNDKWLIKKANNLFPLIWNCWVQELCANKPVKWMGRFVPPSCDFSLQQQEN